MMWKIFENVFVIVAGLIVLFLIATMALPKFGYNLVIIKSGSMEPTIKTGSVIVIHRQDDYNDGDVITFVKDGNSLVTHRIVNVLNENNSVFYRTKGDNNGAEDLRPVKKNMVIGRTMVIVPYVGWIIEFLRTKMGIITMIVVSLIYFIVVQVIKNRKGIENVERVKIK